MPPTFAQLGVPQNICDALSSRGITEPFEIQAATMTDALAGRDVCGRAPTGSGKTLAFGIPLVAQVDRAEPRRPTALILAPTRELADQIARELRTFAGKVRIGVVFGGVGYGPQKRSLNQGVEILVACPGRLEDLIEQGSVSLSSVNKVVLDEADRMADMGFMPAVKRILDLTSPKRQTVLFSATLDGDVAKLTKNYQHNPVRHEVGEETPDITSARHVFWNTTREERVAVTADAVLAVWPAIVFCRTRHGCDRLCKQLKKMGVEATPIHGGRSQNQRTRALESFAKGKVAALVATDVAARGIHVDGVELVVHFDPPEDHKTYVHRSGRTARAGAGGLVVSLIQHAQEKDARKMQRKIDLDEPFTRPDADSIRDESAPRQRRSAPSPQPSVTKENSGDGRDDRDERDNRGGGKKRRKSNPKRGHRAKHTPGESGRKKKSKGSKSGKPGPAKGRKSSDGSSNSNRSKSSGSGGKGSGGKPTSSSSKPKKNNRKARRAHLQTGGRSSG